MFKWLTEYAKDRFCLRVSLWLDNFSFKFAFYNFLRHGEEFLYHIKKFFPKGNHYRKKGSEMEKNGINSGGFAAVSGKMLIKRKMSA